MKQIIALVGAVVLSAASTGVAAELAQEVTQWGITWRFDRPYPTGQFINGDWWVVGPIRLDSITVVPVGSNPSTPSGGRNGFVINPETGPDETWAPKATHAYDSRASGYNAALQPSLPTVVDVNSSIVGTISLDEPSGSQYLKTAAILTVLASEPPADSFRPPYVGTAKPLYSSTDLQRQLLPSLPPVPETPSLAEVERMFERPWIDHQFKWSGASIHPVDNMPGYAASMVKNVGIGGLRLFLDDSLEAKERLLIRYVQLGIDLYGLYENGQFWGAEGGHASGRKWPIVFAGLLLWNPGMINVGFDAFSAKFNGQWIEEPFGEDCQTFFDTAGNPGYGIGHCWGDDSTSYQFCCTSHAWVGQALAARLMGAVEVWNHAAFFDYVDWWVNEYCPGYSSESAPSFCGYYGSTFADNMWRAYRYSDDTVPPLPPTDLEAVSRTDHSIALRWTAPGPASDGDLASSYRILRNGTRVGVSTTTQFEDTGVDSSSTYLYEVYSIDDAGRVSESAAALTVSTLSDAVPPEVVSLVAVSKTQLLVTFSEAVNISDAVLTIGSELIYSLPVSVLGTTLSGDQRVLTLNTTEHTTEVNYFLTLEGVTDLALNLMPMTTLTYMVSEVLVPGGLVGYWHLDDGSGLLAEDASGQDNTGTLVNGPVWVPGKVGGALEFVAEDGESYVEIGTQGWNASQGSVLLWGYTREFSEIPTYFFGHTTEPAWANRIQIYVADSEGHLSLGLGDSHTESTNIRTLAPNTWYHIALTWDGLNYKVYVNTALAAEGTYTGLTRFNTFADIGNDGNPASRFESMRGVVDEVRVYNRPLTYEEIRAFYVLEPPTGLSCDIWTEYSLNLRWNAPSPDPGGLSYRIFRDHLQVGQVTSTSFEDTGLAPDTSYFYEVYSVDGAGSMSISAASGTFSTSADVTPPTIIAAAANDPTTVRVTFSEPVDITFGTFLIDPSVVVEQASTGVEPNEVILNTSPHTPGVAYLLTVNSVQDLAATPNLIAPNSAVSYSLSARVSSGLVAFYPFDEGQGTIVHDESSAGTPLDLEIKDPTKIQWLSEGNGVAITAAGTGIQSPGSATKIHNALTSTDRLTLEVWIAPANLSQTGPARIVTFSGGTTTDQVNFHLGQGTSSSIASTNGTTASYRLRTTEDEFTWMEIPGVFEDTVTPKHLVLTWDGSKKRAYVDGIEQPIEETVSGDLSSWDPSWPLTIGNEATFDRSWLGKVYLLAVYDRVLSGEEVEQNFNVGPNPALAPPPPIPREIIACGPTCCDDSSVASDGAGLGKDSTVLALRANRETALQEHALIRWCLNAMPAGVELLSASLSLTVQQNSTGSPFTLECRPLTGARPYLPECTWNHFDGIHEWPGGSAGTAAQAESVAALVSVGPEQSEVVMDITDLVRDWKTGALENHGLILTAVEGSAPVSCAFHSSEGPEGSRPVLRVSCTGTAKPDTAAPSGSVTFTQSSPYTNQLGQTLSLAVSDNLTDMASGGRFRVSRDNTNWSPFASFVTQLSYDLDAGEGRKRVYVEFEDEAGNVSFRPAVAEITLDQTPPQAELLVNQL